MNRTLYKTHVDTIKLMAEVNKRMPRQSDIAEQINYDNLDAYKQDVKDWQDARICALDIDLPDWTELIRVFDDVMVDSHITAIMQVIKDKIKAKEFFLESPGGERDDEKTEILKAEWFFKFLDICVETIYYPYSIVQLGDVENDEFKDIKLIRREYVIPQKTFIKKNLHVFGEYKTGHDGWSYKDPKFDPYFIEILSEYELGLLDKVAYHALGKKAMLIYWWRYGEMHGLPMRLGKTDITDPQRRDSLENALINMGNSMSAVVDKNDEIMFVESKASGQITIFKDNLEYCNNEISKTFLGTSSTIDERSFVGSAEVGERIFEEKQKSICRRIQFIINNKLIPRMINYGFPLAGYAYKWRAEDSVKFEDKLEAVRTLAPHFEMDAEEVGEALGYTLKPRMNPQQQITEALKAQNSRIAELKAHYKTK